MIQDSIRPQSFPKIRGTCAKYILPLFFQLGQPLSNPLCQVVAQKGIIMTMTTDRNEQLELGYNGAKLCVKPTGRKGRIARAGWWFAQMRNIVACAADPVAEPRPEQIWIPGATREVKV
jgi:hypothetical protein